MWASLGTFSDTFWPIVIRNTAVPIQGKKWNPFTFTFAYFSHSILACQLLAFDHFIMKCSVCFRIGGFLVAFGFEPHDIYIYIYPPQGSTFKYVYGIIWRYHSKDRLIALIDRVCCALPDCSEYAIKRWIGFKRPSWVLLYTALSISGSKKQPQCPFLYLSHTGGDLVTRMYVVEDISKCWQK